MSEESQSRHDSAPEALAQRFHETYERLAPGFGYETRKESAVPWANVPERNKALMVAVCSEILEINLLSSGEHGTPTPAVSDNTKAFFFGVIDPHDLGHFLYRTDGRRVYHTEEKRSMPFRTEVLDGGLLPVGGVEEQGKCFLSVINGWTVLGMWDRTGDKRGASNASFIVEGIHTVSKMRAFAAELFPKQWARIQGSL